MSTLLVGPTPPPHGGISVHVTTTRTRLLARGESCEVIDPGGHRRPGESRGVGRWALRLALVIRDRSRRGWKLAHHTNGANPKSWFLVLFCGLMSRSAPLRVVTLHSGLLPAAVAGASARQRLMLRSGLRLYDRIVCVSPGIREALVDLGIERGRLEVEPAYRPIDPPSVSLSPSVETWLASRAGVISVTLAFRPEYGFDVLLDAMERLPTGVGCLVLGGGDGEDAARRAVAERGLEDRMLLVGDVDHDLCLALIARSNVFVRPTTADGDALSVREALDLGVAVVATDVGTRPPGVRLVPPGDASTLAAAIDRALTDWRLPAESKRRVRSGNPSVAEERWHPTAGRKAS